MSLNTNLTKQIGGTTFEFRIKKEIFGTGEVVYTPQVKSYTGGLTKILSPFEQIIRIYNRYHLQEIKGQNGLSVDDCKEHINGFILQEEKEFQEQNSTIEYEEII